MGFQFGRRKHKYNAKRTKVDNITFASKKEAERYGILKAFLKAGEIANLELQPVFPLHAPNGALIGKYLADFMYMDTRTNKVIVEDSKSPATRTPIYRWKIKHLYAEYGIEVCEV